MSIFCFVLFYHVNRHWPQRQWWKPGVLPGRARTAECNHRAPQSEEGLGSPCTWKTSTARELATSALLPSQRQNQNSPSLDHYIFCTKNELSSNCAGLLLASKASKALEASVLITSTSRAFLLANGLTSSWNLAARCTPEVLMEIRYKGPKTVSVWRKSLKQIHRTVGALGVQHLPWQHNMCLPGSSSERGEGWDALLF